jgi:hypothetical protein
MDSWGPLKMFLSLVENRNKKITPMNGISALQINFLVKNKKLICKALKECNQSKVFFYAQ